MLRNAGRIPESAEFCGRTSSSFVIADMLSALFTPPELFEEVALLVLSLLPLPNKKLHILLPDKRYLRYRTRSEHETTRVTDKINRIQLLNVYSILEFPVSLL